jgi:hypothetical protein
MNVRKAKRNPINHATTFYVPSESAPAKSYMVVRLVIDIAARRKTLWFCQCSDFFGRKLAHFGTNTFSGCKHIDAARRTS